MKSVLAVGLVLATMAPPVGAETLVLDCTFKEQGSTGWIPPRVILSRDLANNTVSVIDGIVQTVYGAPIEATIATENNVRTTYVWAIKAYTNSTGQYVSQFKYRVTVPKSGSAVAISALPVGYANTMQGTGTCKATQK